ncbi:MAG TPA: SGNH/GDSL hydrolase family protein [Herpetosiphonaceae bacterium]
MGSTTKRLRAIAIIIAITAGLGLAAANRAGTRGQAAQGQTPTPANCDTAPVRILFIGNSLTFGHDVPGLVQQIGASARRCVEVATFADAGTTLKMHWDRGKVQEAIRLKRWNFVVLQEQSQGWRRDPAETDAVLPRYLDLIRQNGSQPVIYMTWAWGNEFQNQPNITKFYNDLGAKHRVTVVPVGAAWQQWLDAHPGIRLHEPDNNHANQAGAYLAAAVFYARLFQSTPVGLANLSGLGAGDATALQETAWNAARR